MLSQMSHNVFQMDTSGLTQDSGKSLGSMGKALVKLAADVIIFRNPQNGNTKYLISVRVLVEVIRNNEPPHSPNLLLDPGIG